MTNILLPEGIEDEPEETTPEAPAGPEYKANEEDEERFFLMYHMNNWTK
jgi:hypothetical protein